MDAEVERGPVGDGQASRTGWPLGNGRASVLRLVMHQEWRRLRHHHRLRLGCGQQLQRRPNGRRTRPSPQPLRRLSEAPPSPSDRARRRPFPAAGATEERLEAGPEHGLAMGHLELSGIGRSRPVSRLIRSARRAARGAPRPRRTTAGGRPLRCSTRHPAVQPCSVAHGTSLSARRRLSRAHSAP